MKSKIFFGFVLLLLFSTFAFATTNDAQAYYTLDESTITDDSGNSNTGTNFGATTDAVGLINDSFEITADTQYFTSPYKLNRENLTVSLWVNPDTIGDLDDIFGAWDTTTQILLRLKTGGFLNPYVSGAGGVKSAITNVSISTGVWTHLVYTYKSGTGGVLYVNTQNAYNLSDAGVLQATTEDLNFGDTITSTVALDGRIDEIAIYDRVLTSGEINELYNSGSGFNPYSVGVNMTLTAVDNQSTSSITTFNATVNGTTYQTTNGTITLPYLNNETGTLNITFQADNYFDANYPNVTIQTTYEGALEPQDLIDFTLLTPNNTKTNASTFNVTWTEAVSPTSKVVTYNVTVYNLSNDIEDSFTTTSLFYDLDISGYNADTYNISVNAEENVTGKNYTHSSLLYVDKTNYLYFVDAINSSALVSSNITMFFSNGDEVNYTSDSLGKIEFQSFRNLTLINGSTTFTYLDDQGYISPVNFTYNAQILPINYTFNVSRANLTIQVIDTITGNLVTESVSISITDIGSFTTLNGTLFFEDITLANQNYTIAASSDNYTYVQQVFAYTNQEELTIKLYVYDTRRDNIGTVFIEVYDSFRDIVANADIRIQEFNFSSSSFIEIGQASTNSQGEASFQILLEGKTYRWLVTKTIGGVTYQEYSNEEGEVVFEDLYTIKVYLDTIVDTTEDYYNGLSVTIDNTSLIDNISYHEASFIDSAGASHEVCLNYSYLNGVREIQITGTCVTGASGTLNALVAYDATSYLNDTQLVVTVYVVGENSNRYRQVYAGEVSFEGYFSDLIRPLILVSMIAALAIALYLRRIDYFIYLEILITIVWSMLAPSFMTASFIALNIVLGLMILYLAKKKTNANEI